MASARSYTFRISAEGVDAFARDLGQLGQQSDVAQRALDRLLQSSPTLAGALTKAGAATDAAAARMKAAAATTPALAKGLDQAGASAGVTARQMQQLAPQINDLFTSIASGGPVLLALTQQGGQITQIFGGVRGTLAAVAGVLGPVGIAAGVVAAALATVVGVAESQARTLDGLRDRLRATRSDYESLAASVDAAARSFAAASQFSTGDARKAATTIASTAQFSGSRADLDALLQTAGDLSRVMGTDLPAAAELLAKALKDPAAVAKQLAEQDFRGMNESLARQVELLQKAGEKGAAAALVTRTLGDASRGAAADMSPLSKAWEEFTNRLQGAWDSMRPGVEYLGTVVLNTLSEFLRMVKELDDYANRNPLGRLLGLSSDAAPATASGGGTGVGAGPNANRRALDDALRRVREINPRERQVQDTRANIAALQAQLSNPEATADDRAGIAGALREQQAALVGLRGPVAEYLQGLRDQTALARSAEGAARELAQAEIQARKVAEQDGGNQDAAAAKARVETQRRLTEDLITYRVEISNTVNGNNDLAASWKDGAAAAAAAADKVRAQREALKYGEEGSREYEGAVRSLTASFGALRDSEQAIRDGQQLDAQKTQLEGLQKEGELLTANAATRVRELAMMKERAALVKEGVDLGALTEEQQRRIANAAAIATENAALARQRDAMAELQRVGENAFDRLGQSISTAFTTGSAKALNFGSIVKATVASLATDFAKLGILRPLSNAIFGGNSSTLWDTLGSASSSTGSSGSGLLSTISTWFSGSSGSTTPTTSQAGMSAAELSNSLPSRSSTGSTGSTSGGGGIFSNFSSLMSLAGGAQKAYGFVSGLFSGGSASAAGASASLGSAASVESAGYAAAALEGTAATPAAAAATSSGAAGVAPASTGIMAAAGPYLAGAGLGMMAGSLTGSLRGTANPTGGTAAGTAIGMGVGAIFGPVGAMVGAVIGGALGGLVGPTTKGLAQRSGGDVSYAVDANGKLVITGARGKRWDQAGATASVQGQFDNINTALSDRGITIDSGVSGMIGFGQASKNPHEFDANTLVDDLRSENANVQKALETLAARGTGLEDALNKVDWVTGTYEPAVKAATDTTSEFEKRLQAVRDAYKPIIDQAHDLGLAESALAAARDKELAAIEAQKVAALRAGDSELRSRLAAAQGRTLDASLISFDESAIEQREAYKKQLEGLGLAAAAVTERMGKLNEVLDAERAAIKDATRQQAAGTAAGVVKSLVSYAGGLLVGDSSALSPEEKYALARANFDDMAKKAAGGSLSAASSLSAYSDALLSSSRDLNGSGVGYRADFDRVVSALQSVASLSEETLTTSALNAATEKQTDVLSRELGLLRSEVTALRREVAQGNMIPPSMIPPRL